jgi:predicted phosphodiesterase
MEAPLMAANLKPKRAFTYAVDHGVDAAIESMCNGNSETFYRYMRIVRKEYGWSLDKTPEKPIIKGLTPSDHVDFEQVVLPRLINIGQRAEQKNATEKQQAIEIPTNKPFALAILSDVHGGAKTDYAAIKRDLDIIDSHPQFFAIAAGDITDNFIIGMMQSIQKAQKTTIDEEHRFLRWFLEKLRPSLVAFVTGNHDNWGRKLTEWDIVKELLRDTPLLYDNHQLLFDLKWAGNKQVWKVRHKYRHNSVFNPTHGMEVDWERGGSDFDVAVAGHTHIATLCRPFIKNDKKRYAILLGTYKLRDDYGREIGFADTHSDSRGSGAMVYHPDGRTFWTEDLATATDLLKIWENE